MSGADDDFVEYARASASQLRRTAYLLCRDWDLAADLTQTTLARMFVQWQRISRRDNPHAYARQVLSRTFLDHHRAKRSHEVVTAEFDDTPATPEDADLRLTLIDALGRIPPRDRAILVLRYWEDLSVETVAEILGLPAGTVTSQSARSLARLRHLLRQPAEPTSGKFTVRLNHAEVSPTTGRSPTHEAGRDRRFPCRHHFRRAYTTTTRARRGGAAPKLQLRAALGASDVTVRFRASGVSGIGEAADHGVCGCSHQCAVVADDEFELPVAVGAGVA